MLFTQAAKLEPRFCSGDYRPFLATPKLRFPCSFVIEDDEDFVDVVPFDEPSCNQGQV
jgi:hypothetical protein